MNNEIGKRKKTDTPKCSICKGRTSLVSGHWRYEPDPEPYMSGREEPSLIKSDEEWMSGHVCDSCGHVEQWSKDCSSAPDYRALYEQEKALREAAEEVVETVRKMKPYFYREFVTHTDEFEYYQQLKQQYGQDTGTAR